ncbi:leucine-rich repeats and immunoglobulin-like domains protein 1, partial [Caerostris extrusa]
MLSPVIHSSSNCPRIANIECSCFNISVVCNGTQENDSELQNLLLGLSNITDLQNLTLNIKKITFPMESPFKGFKLKSLSLGIGLDMMTSGFLDGLESSSLLSLNLEHNKIEFFKNPLSSLHNLKELYLGFNDYDIIGSDNFVNLSNLEFLSISGNRIHSLDEDFLEHFPVIHTLILSGNNISTISDLKIISPTLRKLIAQNCSISQTIEKETLSGIANLRYADFSSNGITGVDSLALNELHNLEILNLSYNNINDLNDNAFSSLYNLKELDLGSNQISRIAQNAFINLTQLKDLDLSGNKLHAIIEEYTLDLYSLERINLQNNEIKVIQRGAFNVSRNLQELLLE